MGSIREKKAGKWEITWSSRLLPKGRGYATRDTREDAERLNREVQAELDRGVVRPGFGIPTGSGNSPLTLHDLFREYSARRPGIADSERPMLAHLDKTYGETPFRDVTLVWAQGLTRGLKVNDNVSPGTIKKKIACLARVVDWHINSAYGHLNSQQLAGAAIPANPLRMLQAGYAGYSEDDAKAAKRAGGSARTNKERNRRLEDGEELAIRAVLRGQKDEDRQRSAVSGKNDGPEMEMLFTLALETAMRLREMYTLTRNQVDLKKCTIYLEKTKNGDSRQVPLSTVAVAALRDYITSRALKPAMPIFPWWNGDLDAKTLVKTTARLSLRWSTVFDHARCIDLTFHDLRHEAVCRIFERTTLSDVAIARITGHKTLEMLRRYASLRGSDLAVHLW